MQLLFGALIAAVFLILIFLGGFLGYKLGKKNNLPPPNEDEKNEDEALRQKKLYEDFTKLMNYDVEMALQSKKVTK